MPSAYAADLVSHCAQSGRVRAAWARRDSLSAGMRDQRPADAGRVAVLGRQVRQWPPQRSRNRRAASRPGAGDVGQARGRVGHAPPPAGLPSSASQRRSIRQVTASSAAISARPSATASADSRCPPVCRRGGRRMPAGGMGLRRGPAGLRQRLVIGKARAVEIGQSLPRGSVGPGHEDAAVIARRAAFDPVIRRADQRDLAVQPRPIGKAAGLRQAPDRATVHAATDQPRPGSAPRAPRSPRRAARRGSAPTAGHSRRPSRRRSYIGKRGDHSRAARCRASAEFHIGQAQQVRHQPHQPSPRRRRARHRPAPPTTAPPSASARSSSATASFSARVKRTVSGASASSSSASRPQVWRPRTGDSAWRRHKHPVDPVHLFGGIEAVGARDAHQKRRQRQMRFGFGQAGGGGGQQAAQEGIEHGRTIARTSAAANRFGGRLTQAWRSARPASRPQSASP